MIRNLVKRYVAAMIRTSKTNEGLTEENFKVTSYSFNNRVTLIPVATCRVPANLGIYFVTNSGNMTVTGAGKVCDVHAVFF